MEAKGFPPHTRSLQFLIKWRDEPAPQWYYWTPSFRHYPVVHDFLRAYAQTTQNRNWLRLIPKQHRRDQPAVEYNEEAEQRFLQDLRVVTPGHHLSQPEERSPNKWRRLSSYANTTRDTSKSTTHKSLYQNQKEGQICRRVNFVVLLMDTIFFFFKYSSIFAYTFKRKGEVY